MQKLRDPGGMGGAGHVGGVVVYRKALIKIVVGVAVLAGLGVLFVRSARDVRATPYTVTQSQLASWALTIEPASNGSGRLLSLRAQPTLAGGLFKQIFARAGESMSAPTSAGIPLVLQGEFDRAIAGHLSSDELLQMARAAGLETAVPQPRCLALRRVSEPNLTRQAFFILFDLPAFSTFRRQVAERVGSASGFDPDALSPVLLVAATDAAFERWLPIRADADTDCTAPIAVE